MAPDFTLCKLSLGWYMNVARCENDVRELEKHDEGGCPEEEVGRE